MLQHGYRGKFYRSVLGLLPETMRGSVDYYFGHHSFFSPGGGPMNGQTARLEAVRTLITGLRPDLLVETRTLRATTTEWLAQFGLPVVTAEISPHLHSFSKHRIGARTNVRLMLGSPVDALHRLAAEGAFARGTVFFYLDSHCHEHVTLREELEFIFDNCPSFVGVVDHFQVEGDAGYSFYDHGPGNALTMEYLNACAPPGLAVFFPAVPGWYETGSRRGSVFLTAAPNLMRVMEGMPSLRAWRVPQHSHRTASQPVTPSGHVAVTSRPKLDDVTLCCVDWAQPALAIRAMQASRAQCDFAASLLFTDAEVAEEGIEIRRIPRIADVTSYSHFVLKQLTAHIATPFVLVIQWDGYVLDGARWEDGFREFDYIGAPWAGGELKGMVGNGGFSMRSRRLLSAVEGIAIPPSHEADNPSRQAEDGLICSVWRSALEQRGIRFADAATARRFSVEHDSGEAPSFGFHGMFNFWRTIRADALESVLRGVSPAAARSPAALRLILEYVRLGRWAEANSALINFERQLGAATTIEALSQFTARGVGSVLYDAIRNYGTGQQHASA